MKDDIRRTAENIAESAQAKAEVTITDMYATTVNNDQLARHMRPVLEQASGRPVAVAPLQGASEDFSFYAQATPGLFVFLGITPREQDPATAAPITAEFLCGRSGTRGRGASDVVNGTYFSYGPKADEHRRAAVSRDP